MAGRPKGAKGDRFKEIAEILEAAFDDLGGLDALVKWAKRNPGEFYKVWAKLLPKDIKVSGTLSLANLLELATKYTPEDIKARFEMPQ